MASRQRVCILRWPVLPWCSMPSWARCSELAGHGHRSASKSDGVTMMRYRAGVSRLCAMAVLATLIAWSTPQPAAAQTAGQADARASAASATYNVPPAPIAQILDAAPTPSVDVSPTRSTLAILGRANLPPIAEVAEGELRLAGYRINPRN